MLWDAYFDRPQTVWYGRGTVIPGTPLTGPRVCMGFIYLATASENDQYPLEANIIIKAKFGIDKHKLVTRRVIRA